MTSDPGVATRRRQAVIAGHRQDVATARALIGDVDATVRMHALGALARLDTLTEADLRAAAADRDPIVRRRVAELAAAVPAPLLDLLNDPDPSVVEVAAWTAGERAQNDDDVIERLISLAAEHPAPLVREAAAAALGAIGDERGLPAILAACADRPAVRRRAVLALAPFEGVDVEAAIERARQDRDWQVRLSADVLATESSNGAERFSATDHLNE